MTRKVFITLGRTGDICAILPMLYALAQRGERNKLMVAAEFASLLEGVSYVEPLIYNGPHYEVAKASEQTKAHGEPIVCQVNGPRADIEEFSKKQAGGHNTDSFIKETWRLAGNLPLWHECPPLVFDRRDPGRERSLLEVLKTVEGPMGRRSKRLMLVSLRGNTSPFEHADLCLELLRLKYGRYWSIVDLSTIRAINFYDLLVLYERASLLVASDSAPLHLAMACPKLPVVALVNDRPSLWHGSPWRPNHLFTCRYGDFPKRAVRMLRAIDTLGEPGCWFTPYEGKRIIHCWNQAEETESNLSHRYAARQTWQAEYLDHPEWVNMPIWSGAVGRTSDWLLQDPERHPYLKAAMQLPLMRAREDDLIVLTRSTTAFTPGITAMLAGPSYARRRVNGQHHPSVDLFAADKKTWQAALNDCPDFVLGKDRFWSRVLMEVFRKHGAKEVSGAVFTTTCSMPKVR